MHALALDRDRYMRAPVDGKRIGLHAKLMLVDRELAYVGSCNLDPRSLRLNTETGLVVRSAALNGALRELLAADFDARNAWAVSIAPDGVPQWRAQGEIRGAPRRFAGPAPGRLVPRRAADRVAALSGPIGRRGGGSIAPERGVRRRFPARTSSGEVARN